MTKKDDTLALTYMLSPPASLDELQLRAELVASRWVSLAGTCRDLIQNHLNTVQASTLGTMEQFRRAAMEAAFLSSPPRAESIDIS
ncbi:MAG: hypothetical protein R3F07_09265 [Opitutaceae bacterium]